MCTRSVPCVGGSSVSHALTSAERRRRCTCSTAAGCTTTRSTPCDLLGGSRDSREMQRESERQREREVFDGVVPGFRQSRRSSAVSNLTLTDPRRWHTLGHGLGTADRTHAHRTRCDCHRTYAAPEMRSASSRPSNSSVVAPCPCGDPAPPWPGVDPPVRRLRIACAKTVA